MIALFLLLLSCLPCFAQFGVEQPMFQLTSVSTTPQLPTGDLFVWLKPESLIGAQGVGVTNWPDSSGLYHDVTNINSGVQQPYVTNSLINGYSGARFVDGSSYGLRFGTNDGKDFFKGQNGVTLHFFARVMDDANSSFFRASGTAGDDIRLLLSRVTSPTAGKIRIQGRAPDAQTLADSISSYSWLTSSQFELWSFVFYFTNATAKVYRDGTLQASLSSFIGPSALENTADDVVIGFSGSGMNFELVEFIGYTNAQSGTALAQTFDYVGNKYLNWGTTNNSLLLGYDIGALGYSDGTAISNVPDSGPYSLSITCSPAASRPYWTNDASLNGDAWAQFDGSNDYLTNNFTTVYAQPLHVFIVANGEGIGGVSSAMWSGAFVSGDDWIAMWEFNNEGVMNAWNGAQLPVTFADSWKIWETCFNGQYSFVRTNNVIGVVGNLGTYGIKGFHLGNNIGLTGPFKGGIAWVGIYTNRLTSLSASNLVQTLGTRYGITTYTRN